ncbi:hypothetical protein Acr_05g0004190 [Actinidia rufa]|uniref:Elongator complex protein 5 n=1 Tax=Actinidia rufa TaxID=165716 RepID=A0A7J0EK67_9ERIC|nr:hypothetical protein Acr_05g0004190 [Actinidia rufa]
MAELIRRALRDGALDGEHAPALTIKDNIDSPFGPHVFNHVLAQLSANILAGKSQSQGIVLVASSWSPSFYFDMLKSRENDVASFQKWLCKDVRNLDNLFSSILQLGKELVGQGKGRFSVAIDSSEDFCIEQSGIKFTPRSGDGETISQSLVPKVQFNLQLSEKERIERAKVVLPFEHQGIGKPIEIYDGRQSLNENNIENSSTTEKLPTSQDPGKGEIIYFRDSDDEMPDSDEDPDDDLDI